MSYLYICFNAVDKIDPGLNEVDLTFNHKKYLLFKHDNSELLLFQFSVLPDFLWQDQTWHGNTQESLSDKKKEK